jgi:DNA-binding SARP family transcriptional activator
VRVGRNAVASGRILGLIEVWDGERRLDLGGWRQVALFACLLLSANRAASTERLLESLWRDGDAARKRLQMAVRRLRQATAPASGVVQLETVAGGYLLRVADGELDSLQFTAEVAAARVALQADELGRAAELIQHALQQWRGPPLPEVAFEDFAQEEIRRLEEAHLTAR